MWKLQRKLMSYLFNENKFQEIYCNVFEEKTNILLKLLQKTANNNDVIDLQDLFYNFTMDTFGK